MKTSALKLLYNNVSQIISKHSALGKATGENFNVFRILGLESAEVRTHSAFLCELLNSEGSHGQGDQYLKLFTKMFSITNIDTFSSTSKVEKKIGYITPDYKNGGRIDIFIKDKNTMIYANDDYDSLKKYSSKLIYDSKFSLILSP